MKLRPGQKFHTGYLPDPDGHSRTPFAVLKRRLRGQALPDAFSLSAFTPTIMDQGQTGSCTGHATSGAFATTFAAAGTPLPWVPSPHGIYTLGRAIDRVPNADGTEPPLDDNGAQPNQVMRGVSEWGIRPTGAPAADGRNSDCDPATINEEPAFDEIEKDSEEVLDGEYEITSTGAQREEDIKVALAVAKVGVTFAIDGGSQVFQGYTGGIIDAAGDQLDHYVYADGYEYVNGVFVLHGVNSWGAWGESGRFKLSSAGVAQLGDIVAAQVRRS